MITAKRPAQTNSDSGRDDAGPKTVSDQKPQTQQSYLSKTKVR